MNSKVYQRFFWSLLLFVVPLVTERAEAAQGDGKSLGAFPSIPSVHQGHGLPLAQTERARRAKVRKMKRGRAVYGLVTFSSGCLLVWCNYQLTCCESKAQQLYLEGNQEKEQHKLEQEGIQRMLKADRDQLDVQLEKNRELRRENRQLRHELIAPQPLWTWWWPHQPFDGSGVPVASGVDDRVTDFSSSDFFSKVNFDYLEKIKGVIQKLFVPRLYCYFLGIMLMNAGYNNVREGIVYYFGDSAHKRSSIAKV